MAAVRLFVYGTLQPGHLRWPLLAPAAIAHRPARSVGDLYDSGAGWPVARFGGDRLRSVPGVAVELDPAQADELLTLLDGVEGVADGRYRRIVVALDDGTAAWAYHWTGTTSRLVPIDAWADQLER